MPSPTAEVQVGSVLRETYEIIAPLSRGGMGAIYVARHLRLPGKQVAVKVLHGGGISPAASARFRREAEIASRLGHPNIVEVLDFDTLPGGAPFLVMELMRGESLGQRLSRGPLPWQEAQEIARQVGSALGAAHRAGIVHRDLKPDNVFLVAGESGGMVSERVKLLDFGISKITAGPSTLMTQDQVLMGTPLYMAPEQALGKNSETDARTDIFAFGCILYEMLSGRPPFAAESTPLIIYRIVHEEPAPLSSLCPSLPPRAARAIERALAKAPLARFPGVESFIAELTGSPLPALPAPTRDDVSRTQLLVPSPTVAEGPPSRSGEPRRRAKPWILAGALALALALGLLGGAALLWRGASRPERDRSTRPPEAGAAATADASAAPPAQAPALAQAVREDPVPRPVAGPPERAPRPSHPALRGSPSSRVPADQAREARTMLARAEKALGAGDAGMAIDLARRAERSDPSVSTHAVLTMAYCTLGDLGNARPEFDRVPRAQRKSVESSCKRHGVDLVER